MTERLPETENWVRMSAVSRRATLGGAAAAIGYALAARPVSASAVQTPADGLVEGDVRFAAADGFEMSAYRARPAGSKPAPVIFVIQEIFGLHAWIRDITRRLAHAGYYAIAPNLYQREGDPTAIADIQTLVTEIVAKVPDAQVLADLDALARFAATDGGDAEKLGITGFCWGGRITWLYAAHNPALKAGVAWYGRLLGNSNPLQPAHPIDVAARLHAPVLGLYGTADKGIPLADVEQFSAALQAADSPSRIRLFDGADHGFLADYRPSFHPSAAQTGWTEMLRWFGTNGLAVGA